VQSYVTAAGCDTLLDGCAATQTKNGSPYAAEAHDPADPLWIYDQPAPGP
jgi:hypothetical protein